METIPRGPLFLDGGNDADRTENYENQMREYRIYAKNEAYRTFKNSPEFEHVQKYIAYLEGKQWPSLRARYKSRFVNNRIQAARRDRLALLTDSKPIISVNTNVDEFKDEAGIIANVIRAEWLRNDVDLSLVTVADIAMLWGTGFWKLGAASPGVMTVVPCGPDNVMPIQPQMHIQDSSAVLYRTWKAPSYFKKVFPFTSGDISKLVKGGSSSSDGIYQKPSGMGDYTWNGLSQGFQRILGAKAPLPLPQFGYGAVELEEYYVDDQSVNESSRDVVVRDAYLPMDKHNWWYVVKPGHRLYPRKRLIVFGGDTIMYDGPSPYWHGLYPFSCLRFDPVPWSFHGISSYRNLLPLQESMNEITAGTMDMVKRALNPTAITKEGSVSNAAWKDFLSDMPGAKLKLNPLANTANDIRYMEQPPIPPYVFDMLVRYISPEFDKMSGIMDVAAMTRKNQVPGGETLEQMKDSLQTSMRLDMRFIEAFMRDAGIIATSNVLQFYNTKRRLQLLGEDGITLRDFDFNGANLIPQSEEKETFWKNFSFSIIPGSLHSGAKDKARMEAFTLLRMGKMSIRTFLIDYMDKDPGTADKIIAELESETANIAEQATQGRSPRSAAQKSGNIM